MRLDKETLTKVFVLAFICLVIVAGLIVKMMKDIEPEKQKPQEETLQVEKNIVDAEKNEYKEDILNDRHIDVYSYHIDSRYGRVAEIYNAAIDQMFRNDTVSYNMYINDKRMLLIETDLNKMLFNYKIFNNNPEINKDELNGYFQYENGNVDTKLDTPSNTVYYNIPKVSAYEGTEKIVEIFWMFIPDFNTLTKGTNNSNDINYSVDENASYEGRECYKITMTTSYNEGRITDDIYIDKANNVILYIEYTEKRSGNRNDIVEKVYFKYNNPVDING